MRGSTTTSAAREQLRPSQDTKAAGRRCVSTGQRTNTAVIFVVATWGQRLRGRRVIVVTQKVGL